MNYLHQWFRGVSYVKEQRNRPPYLYTSMLEKPINHSSDLKEEYLKKQRFQVRLLSPMIVMENK